MIMIDTDILIWIFRGNEKIIKRFKQIVLDANGLLFITPVQISEIFAGIRENEKIKTSIFIDSLNCIGIDKNIGETAGYFVNQFSKSHNVTILDAIICSAAIINNLKLWTLNKKHYPMLKSVDFID